MNRSLSKRALFLLFALLMSQLVSRQVLAQDLTPITLTLDVSSDGIVRVLYVAKVDPELPNVNISIFGLTSEVLVVTDEDGALLDYTQYGSMLNVDSLGASQLTVEYYTHDLTVKTGQLWTLVIRATIDFNVTFPVDATIVDVSEIPLKIGTINQHPALVMPRGAQNISYIVGAIGPRGLASETIALAEQTMSGIKAKGLTLTQADGKLAEAKNLFKVGNYTGAKTSAEAAITAALLTQQKAETASLALKEAQTAASEAKAQGRTGGLTEAETLLQRSREAFEGGRYAEAEDLANQARTKAQEAKTPFPLLPVALGIGSVVSATIGVFYVARRRKKRGVDPEKIFEKNVWLRQEHRTIILMLAEKGGAFEAEIRDRLKLPKSTAWRIVKRLEEEGILEIEQVRGQNYVRLKK